MFTNPQTGKSARAKGVLHFAESGAQYAYIWPVGTAAQFSSAIGTGITLQVRALSTMAAHQFARTPFLVITPVPPHPRVLVREISATAT